MDLENFSTKWFTLYFTILAIFSIGGGSYLVIKKDRISNYFKKWAQQEKPPTFLVRILKYFFLFSLPGVVLSFIPFSWIELLFTIWSLMVVYIAGIQLVRWENNRKFIKSSHKVPDIIRKSGAIMVAVGFALLLLAYFVLIRPPLS